MIGPDGATHSVVAKGSGPTLIFLHGFPLDHRMWLEQLEYFSQRYQVICPEFRGFGQSSTEESFSLAQLADDVEFIRSKVAESEKVFLCGLSMGGYVAFEYWARHSRHLAGLILANTKPTVEDERGRSLRLRMAEMALQVGALPATQGMAGKLLGPSAPEQASQLMAQIISSVPAKTLAASQRAMASRKDFSTRLGSMETPTLVITGEHDIIAPPEDTQQWAVPIPNCQFEVLADVGHMSPIENASGFNQLLDAWLTKLTQEG